MIYISLFDTICLFLIFLLLLYKIRNKTDITFYVILFILVGIIILRCNNHFIKYKTNNYYENFNSSLDIYYPSKKDGNCNSSDEECIHPAINKKLDKKFDKKNTNNTAEYFGTNSSLDIYYPDDSCEGENCANPAVNKNIELLIMPTTALLNTMPT